MVSHSQHHLTLEKISATQSISGTGALRIGAAFLARHYPHSKVVYLPSPSWGNHVPIFRDSGFEVRNYSYFDPTTLGLNFEALKTDLLVSFTSVGSSGQPANDGNWG
jgi:aspartate aminotransferase